MHPPPRPVDRMLAAVHGQVLDRPVWSLWRHFYDRESTAAELAAAMVQWQRKFGFDFIKVNPRAHYHVEAWGARYAYTGRPEEKPRRLDYPVKQPGDWARIQVVDPHTGALGEQLEALRLVRQEVGGVVPFIETIFSPLMVASYLVGSDDQLVRDLRECPERVRPALGAIAETFAAFAAACLREGAAGLFFATTWATHRKLTPAEYAAFGRPYDLHVLAAAQSGWLNVLHVCGEGIMLFDLADYPVQAFSWATNAPGNPSLAEARTRLPGLHIGGLSHGSLTAATPSLAEQETRAALAQTRGQRWALGPACSIPVASRDANIRAAGRVIGVEGE